MVDEQEVPHTSGKAGYDWDPYSAPVQLADIHSPNIPFHNYRQIHVSEVAWGEGVRAISLRNLPECPPRWSDVAHYWYVSTFAGYMCQEFLSSQLWVKIVAAIPITLAIQYGLGLLGIHITV